MMKVALSILLLYALSSFSIDETAKGRYYWAKGTGLKHGNKTKKK
jgi:hypothetical protein